MKNLLKAFFAFGILLPFNVSKSNAETFRKYEAKVNGITYSVDPRIELFNTVAMLFGHNGMTLSNISYKQETLTYFASYKLHPVVDSLLNSFKGGWGVDDPVFFMLCLDSKFDLKPGLSSGLIERAHDTTTYFIMGTHEANKDAQASLKAFVLKYRNMISTSSVIITDEEALKMPLNNNDLIIFGTPEGNTFLKKYIDRLPVKIFKDRVLTDKVLMGDDYQVVTSWVSPFNAKKAMVIYTAQKTENIKNYDYSLVKDQYHYWVAKNTITIDKGDYSNYWQMWMFSL